MTFINACWMFTETKQWMLAQWGGGWRFSAVATATWKTSHVLYGHAQLSHNEINTRELCTELNIGFNALETMVAMLEYRKVCARWVPRMLIQAHKEYCMQVCQDLLNQYEAKVTVSWIASSLVMRCGVTTMSRSKSSSPWSGSMWIPHRRKSSRRCPQRVKRCALSFGMGMGWSFWISSNLDKPSTLAATSWHWLSWRLEFPESGQRRKQPFSCNMIALGPIPVWRPWSTLSILAGLSYHTHHIVRIWPLLTSICSGRWKMDCVDIFLASMPLYELWNSGPPPLVQIFTSAACRLLFIAGESA